ncbi:unnamed protein product [Acanthoscelides obtectus]|uniref:EGF-like domain-containing protein n=1 Tax=Acanthoscelides obtectus TaxID=200917 RepID=A0A9P0PI16_ACAOB|nr:unnamed protein product [Acanthoscelides obtectus]CAK1620325.1 Fibrillin-1 [Acanthoscelides obtectus]
MFSDVNECEKNPCGQNATCKNTPGSYVCSCKEDYTGDPYKGCEDINECVALEKPCGPHAVCQNAAPGYTCLCPQGYQGSPTPQVACEQVDVTTLCTSNFDCTNNAECTEGQCFCRSGFKPSGASCVDVDECSSNPCGPFSVCHDTVGSFKCECESGYVGAPPMVNCKAPCEDIACGEHAYCKADGIEAYCICEDGWTFNPADIAAGCIDIDECDKANGPSGRCGANAICTNLPGTFACQCEAGFTGNPNTQCTDIDECTKPDTCGLGAICKNTPGSYQCECPEGTVPDPDAKTKCNEIVTCTGDADCPGNAVCDGKKRCLCPEPNVGNDCRHPCEATVCGPNEECMLVNQEAKCICSNGYTGSASGCVDIDECAGNPCPSGAVCKNEPGSFSCQCPGGTTGDAYRTGCTKITKPHGCSEANPCPSGEQCVLDDFLQESVCICVQGYVRDPETGKCRDNDECTELRDKPVCGINAICKNLPGSYDCQCPPGFNGNPFLECLECNSPNCRCQPPYKLMDGNCVLASCEPDGKCPSGAECITITGGVSYCACPKGFRTLPDGSCKDVDECAEQPQACGYGAECRNIPGSYECHCPIGYGGEPYNGICAPAQKKCMGDKQCSPNEKCIQPGECVCPPPYFTDAEDGNKCKSPCERYPCGLNAKCTPSDPPKCVCETGFKGDPLQGCEDVDECSESPCAYGAHCLNQRGGYKCVCPKGMTGDAYKGGCILETPGSPKSECHTDTDCASILSCQDGTCISPCATVLCGPHARCEPKNHKGKCVCDSGYNKNSEGHCVSMCEGTVCAPGAQCIVTSSGPTCKCQQDLIGNPFPGGQCTRDVCSKTNPCEEPNVCINGRCKQRCEGVICGIGAHCNPDTNKCVCDHLFVGNPNMLCMPPITGPTCDPVCGKNAHCEYGLTNQCVCNTGTVGNPYEACERIERTTCSPSSCGKNAECRDSYKGIECVCGRGFTGNPYISCEDLDECATNVCGNGAVCINTVGSYDCRCKEGYAGNPFVMCSQVQGGICREPENCQCSDQLLCPLGYNCQRGQCRNLCADVKCGPGASCEGGICMCSPGYFGNPSDLVEGCKMHGQCSSDADCFESEICFQFGKGVRKCVDACSKVQCGPNALCVAENHRSSCICNPGFSGNPGDLNVGCQLEKSLPPKECENDHDCSFGTICSVDANGIQKCISPCETVACGTNEVCQLDVNGHPTCACKGEYIWNPVTSACEKPSVPDCSTDVDCELTESCQPDALNILKCVPVCDHFTCPDNAACVAEAHRGQCHCLTGYTGNPNDRNGCKPLLQNQCTSDAECQEQESCRKHEEHKIMMCQPACDQIKCGPNAICVVNNHAPQCQCPPGAYAGDPNDLKTGCKSVPCVYNIDCPKYQLCDRMSHTCKDVCDDESCGDNAVCIAEDHKSVCQCPPGTAPNPIADVECIPVEPCKPSPCHKSAICRPTSSGHTCVCPPGKVGDPYASGCRPEGDCPNGDVDCPPKSVCKSNRCVNPCDHSTCGPNAVCIVQNRTAICTCPSKYIPAISGMQDGCLRITSRCEYDVDCGNDVCFSGQCRSVCRNNNDCSVGEKCMENICMIPCADHSQCAKDQACVNATCIIGCRSNKNCLSEEACINNKCQNPCQDAACGPNAICSAHDHKTVCKCPPGFDGNPTPQQGCIRTPSLCQQSSECIPQHVCHENQCSLPCQNTTGCAIGERCYEGFCVKVCYSDNNCLHGEICLKGVCQPGCAEDKDCRPSQICSEGQCKCDKGFIGTPLGCMDIDECEANPCHPTAICKNQPGSYTCICEEGNVGDPFTDPGCAAPGQCRRDTQCADNLACKQGKCQNPCETSPCGAHAVCTVTKHKPSCSCPPGHLGDPQDKTLGCFKVECLEDIDCPSNKFCDVGTNRCLNPCDAVNCGKGTCSIEDHHAICSCFTGYAFKNNKCVDINECLESSPCHSTATCINTDGGFTCSCTDGLVGDPVGTGCRKPGDCLTDTDCPSSAACIDNKCRNPCDIPSACGKNAECIPVAHEATCRCPARTKEDANHNCIPIECVDNNDCVNDKACVDSKCVNPCTLANVCGEKADCTASNHQGVCVCQAGTTGDPHLGCVPVQYCAKDAQCPSGLKCYNGLCTSICSSSRECIGDQLCIQGICQPTCKTNTSCPEHQFCQNNICIQEVKCRANPDCDSKEKCLTDPLGRAECIDACEGVLCGRNAECTSKNHKASCSCKAGYKGNPNDDKLGCQKVECETNEQCSNDKLCDQYMCKIACLVHNPCGKNALCSAEHHKQTCYCQPGYTGDPLRGCKLIDFCADSPCGPGAQCHNSRGSFKCQCPQGQVGDPYNEGCRAPVECNNDNDCPSFASCDKSNGVHKCRDVCEKTQCLPNAECVAVDHVGHCTCRDGYQGDPNDPVTGCKPKLLNCRTTADCPANTYCYGDVCSPPCQENVDCQHSEQCLYGQCINPCVLPKACGVNALCEMEEHVKTCSCPHGFTGNTEVECIRLPVPCSTNQDCTNSSVCKDNMCQPRCKLDTDCAYNEKCLKGNCQLTCRVDNDCFLGHICLHHMCFFGCHSDDDCASTESCINNKCASPCSANPCGPNAICTVSNHRATCSCGEGFVPNPSAKVACVRAPAQPCKENRECQKGNICTEGFCRTICSSDKNCLSNERCETSTGVCKPICRKDDDCRNDEICEGLACTIGCRSDSNCPSDAACVNNKCVDLCAAPTACGTNALCQMVEHKKQCVCPEPLVGDPLETCKYPLRQCLVEQECLAGQTCVAGTCQGVCRTDHSCLADERCIKGVCKTVCNSDASCGPTQICENRICEIGCRSDSVCASDQACINNKCTNPCGASTTCGTCANCTVNNHVAQCSCPINFLGNPLVACTQVATRCNPSCECDEVGYCTKSCSAMSECSCGETCVAGKCRNKCTSQSQCAQGQLCTRGACLPGCKSNNDCPNAEYCKNRKCQDPCAQKNACGKSALCQAADHRKVCLCPDGYQGDPAKLCEQYECSKDEDCESNKKCGLDKVCRNPCLEHNACGANAQCRVVDRKPLCSCPPGYIGNAQVECKQTKNEECLKNPCGSNAKCKDIPGGYECSCPQNCIGDPYRGCECEQELVNLCKNKLCGVGAKCRVVNRKEAQCYCPAEKPVGDPTIECSSERSSVDCRTEGCGKHAECIREQALFVCRCLPGYTGNAEQDCERAAECNSDLECPNEKACINFQCIDPCSLRGACGLNALCETVSHRPRCTCPECHTGMAGTSCHPDHQCLATQGRPATKIFCRSDYDCNDELACNTATGECFDPCEHATFKCRDNKKCEVHHHRPACVCKKGFKMNENGEISCAPDQAECNNDDECPSNKTCIYGFCKNPCTEVIKSPCSPDKGCDVLNHKPICICLKNCTPSLSICLRDNGCPQDQACRAFRCEDPCLMANCPENSPCHVEDHRPVCKFCPAGFKSDPKYGCVQDILCRSHSECSSNQACINKKCQNPCVISNPCSQSQDCQVQEHQPVCVKVCQCQKDSDCGNHNYVCDGCQCAYGEPRIPAPQCPNCPPGIPCNPLTGVCLKDGYHTRNTNRNTNTNNNRYPCYHSNIY